MTVPARAPTGRYSWACVLAGLATLLTACSSSHPSTITGTGGSTQSVAISSSTGNFQVQQGAQLLFTATVPADSTNAGVTWSVSGGGALSNETNTTATYTAPTGITGTSSPIVTAKQRTAFVAGVAFLWLVSDWPLHDIAERYLYSAHMIQHLVMAFVAAPLFLIATPRWLADLLLADRSRPARAVRARGSQSRDLLRLGQRRDSVLPRHAHGADNV